MSTLPVDVLEREWERELAGPVVAEHLRRWGLVEPVLARFARPVSLVRYLGRGTPARQKDEALCALLRCARHDALAARLVLQTLLPGLKRRVGRVLIDVQEREELWSAVLDHAWTRIRAYPVGRLPHHVAANLMLSAVRDELRPRERQRERARGRVDDSPVELPDPDSELEPPARLGIDGLLAAAVKAGAITAKEARLIARTRVDGVPLVLYASEEGGAYDALRIARRRAERRLLLHLGARSVERTMFGLGGRNGLSVVLGSSGEGPTGPSGEKTNRHPRRR
jgi:hypothetical protein